MKLFHFPQTCATAAHIVLEESGAEYELHTVKLAEGEHKTPEYLAINPKGKIPALDVEGTILTENVAILYFLAKQFPEKRLFPDDPLLEAEWMSVMTFISNSLHIAGAHITVTYHYADDEAVYPELRRKGRLEFAKFLGLLDKRLEQQDWLVGSHYTTADAYLMAFIAGFSKFEIPVAEYPNLKAWVVRMLQRDAVRRVLENEASIVLEMDEFCSAEA